VRELSALEVDIFFEEQNIHWRRTVERVIAKR
jgi:hypothetical protein